MSIFKMFKRGQTWLNGFWVAALAFLLALPAQAQTQVTLTSASASQLQEALSFNSLTSTQTVMCAFNGTITLNSALFIGGNIILEATTNFNVTIQAAHGMRIFQVQTNVNFTLENLILAGGDSAGTNGSNGGLGVSGIKGGAGTNGTSGAMGFGGAIYNLGTNTVINCIFLTNNATGGNGGSGGGGGNGTAVTGGNGGTAGNGGAALGGAIYNLGTLSLSNCTFAGNGVIAGSGGTGGTNGTGGGSFPGAGGVGGVAAGGGLYNQGKVIILGCTFDFNFCEGGNSQAAGGTPGGNGNGPAGPTGGNGEGGGIYSVGANASIKIINSTFAGNLVEGGAGGNGGQPLSAGLKDGSAGNGGNAIGAGIFNDAGATVAVTNCTFADGSTFGGTNGLIGTGGGSIGAGTGSIGVEAGGNIANLGTFLLKNSILAYATNGGNISGTITDQGFNISDDATPVTHTNTTRIDLDPLLFPLATNGGPTLTFDLQSGSPAFNAITGTNVGIDFPPLDQRGFPRPIQQFADIGAVETGTPSFSISGFISPVILDAYTNVVINVVGSGLTFSTMPDGRGFYSFPSLPPDIYTITPQPTNGFSFGPINLTVTLATTNPTSTDNDFVATPSFTVSGIISNLSATATVNIFVTNNGNNTFFRQTTTAANGIYTFTNVPTQNYLITPIPTSTIAFSPASLLITNLLADNTNLNFTEVPPTFLVTGQITNTGGVIVMVNASSSVSASTQTDANGNYALNLIQGTYIITPQAGGLSFTPPTMQVSVPPSTNLPNFGAQTSGFSLSGQIANIHQAVAVSAVSSANSYNTSSDTSGNYAFGTVASGTYTVTPQPVTGVGFSPTSRAVVVSSATTAPAFTAVISNYTISGQILLGTNGARPYPNVTVIANGTNAFTSINSYSAQTDASGNYTVPGLPTGNYIVTPQPVGFFMPASNSVMSLSSSVANVNFTGLTDTNSVLLISHVTNSSLLKVSFEKWIPNVTYRIQSSSNLMLWQDMVTNTPGSNTSSIALPVTGTNQFFRAVTP